MCVAKTSPRQVLQVTMIFKGAFRGVRVLETTKSRSVEIAPCVVKMMLENMKMQLMSTSLRVSMVESLRNYLHTERNFVILHGTTSSLPDILKDTEQVRGKTQVMHSGSSKRI